MTPSRDIILIIDDNEQNRYTFSRYLRRDNFEVWTASTGEEGLALARRHPSLIMLDIQLPDTTGYELCRILKTDPATASIPVLHTSAAFTESSDKVFGLEGGADGYLTQPIDSRELNATIRALLRVRAAEQAARALASQWQATFDSVRDGLCLLNMEGRIERFNRAFAALFPKPDEISVGLSFDSLIAKLGNPSLLRTGGTASEIAVGHCWYRVTHDSIKDGNNEVLGEAWVFSDITKIRQAELTLQNHNQELEQRVARRTASLQDAVHQLEQFSYAVSHDLRAPLRAMQGYSDALLEDFSDQLPSEGLGYLQRIAANAARLDKMIVDVLTFTRISRETPMLTPIPLQGLIENIIEHYPGLKPPQAEITLDVPHVVMSHESGLMQAFSNLLGNAIKFMAPGVVPKIRVVSETRGSEIRIWIEDNGIGILPEYQHRLFGMFQRVLPVEEYEGTGVGLAITRKVVERMGGTVGMESDGIHGSRFWVQLQGVGETA